MEIICSLVTFRISNDADSVHNKFFPKVDNDLSM